MQKQISKYMSALGKKGATKRWENTTPEQKKAHMEKMRSSAYKGMTKEQISERISQRMKQYWANRLSTDKID